MSGQVQRRGFLKGLGAALGLAAVAPEVLPDVLRGLAPVATPLAPPVAAQPVYLARGFIPYSIELIQDYPDVTGEVQFLLQRGQDDELAEVFSYSSSARRVRARDAHGRFMKPLTLR